MAWIPAPTTFAGDGGQSVLVSLLDTDITNIVNALNAFNPSAVSPGIFLGGTSRLTYVSATQIQLGLGVIPIKIGSIWTLVPVTPAVTLSNAGLAASTTYYIYAFGSTPTLVASATGHSTDSTFGIEVLSSDATRTLVGMVRTNGSSQFEADNALWGVLSWYARRGIGIVNNYTANRTTTSATFVEPTSGSEIRANVLTWGDETVYATAAGEWFPTASATMAVGLAADSTTVPAVSTAFNVTTGGPGSLSHVFQGLSEGFHFIALLAATSASTANFTGGTLASAGTTYLSVGIRG
jgi:hypothetical protein